MTAPNGWFSWDYNHPVEGFQPFLTVLSFGMNSDLRISADHFLKGGSNPQ